MAWCRQATSHYLSQCWPRSLSPYGITKPQWVNCFIFFFQNMETMVNRLWRLRVAWPFQDPVDADEVRFRLILKILYPASKLVLWHRIRKGHVLHLSVLLAICWSVTFSRFSHIYGKLFTGLIAYLVNTFIMMHPRPYCILVTHHWIPAVSWHLISWAVSACLNTVKPLIGLSSNLMSELIMDSLGLTNFWSCSAEFLPFSGLPIGPMS